MPSPRPLRAPPRPRPVRPRTAAWVVAAAVLLVALLVELGRSPEVAAAPRPTAPATPIHPVRPALEAADRAVLDTVRAGGPAALDPAADLRYRFWKMYGNLSSRLVKVHDGALIADAFDRARLADPPAPAPDEPTLPASAARTSPWRIWNPDPGLRVELEAGALRIAGVAGPEAGHPNFNGIVSERFGETDLVLVAEVELAPLALGSASTAARPAEADAEAGEDVAAAAIAHLCGTEPDWFRELAWRAGAGGLAGWHHDVRGWRDPRGLDPRAGDGGPLRFTLRVEHAAADESGGAWIRPHPAGAAPPGDWLPVGGRPRIPLSSLAVELKVNATDPGLWVDTRFDDVRLYPRPETHPVRLLLCGPPSRRADVGVELRLDDEETAVAEGRTDELGRVRLDLPADRAYPAAARVRFLFDDAAIELEIPAADVHGLYPGDSWVARVNERDLEGDTEWWRALYEGRDPGH